MANRRRHQNHASSPETLEPRELLSVSTNWNSQSGVLSYRADDNPNTISLETSNGRVSLREVVNGVFVVRDSRSLVGIKQIDVGARGGSDTVNVTVNDPKTPNMRLYGESGNDRFTVAMGVDFPKLSNNQIDALFGRVDIIGGSGLDFVDLSGSSPRSFTVREVEQVSGLTVIKAQKELADVAKHPEMTSPWKLSRGMPIFNDITSRSAASYAAVIDQVQVLSHMRYAPDGVNTYCNLLAGDIFGNMDAALPKKASDPNMTAPTRELAPWLAAQNGGWRAVSATGSELLAHVRAGKPALAIHSGGNYDALKSAANPTGKIEGHIVVIRPDQPSNLNSLTTSNLANLRIAQAGAVRFNSGAMSDVVGWRVINYRDVKFYIHD